MIHTIVSLHAHAGLIWFSGLWLYRDFRFSFREFASGGRNEDEEASCVWEVFRFAQTGLYITHINTVL